MTPLLGDAFQSFGIEVLYSFEADNDHTLAAYAFKDGASVLSGDKDFFRYKDAKYIIYGSYEIKKGQLKLIELQKPNSPSSPRDIINPVPKVLYQHPSLVDLSYHVYRRGASTSLCKNSEIPILLFVLYVKLSIIG